MPSEEIFSLMRRITQSTNARLGHLLQQGTFVYVHLQARALCVVLATYADVVACSGLFGGISVDGFFLERQSCVRHARYCY